MPWQLGGRSWRTRRGGGLRFLEAGVRGSELRGRQVQQPAVTLSPQKPVPIGRFSRWFWSAGLPALVEPKVNGYWALT